MILRCLLVFLIPLCLCLYLYPPFNTFRFSPETAEERRLIVPNEENITKNVIADILQTKTGLSWYKVCLDNKSYAIEDGRRLPDEELKTRSRGISISINSGDGYTKTLLAPPDDEECLPVFIDSDGVTFGDFTIDYRVHINLRDQTPGSGELNMGGSPVIIKNSLWGWLGRYALLLVAVGGLILLAKGIYLFIRDGWVK